MSQSQAEASNSKFKRPLMKTVLGSEARGERKSKKRTRLADKARAWGNGNSQKVCATRIFRGGGQSTRSRFGCLTVQLHFLACPMPDDRHVYLLCPLCH